MIIANITSLIWSIWSERKRRAHEQPHLSPERAKLITETAQRELERHAIDVIRRSLDKGAEQLTASVETTIAQLATHLSDFATNGLSQEFEKYHVSLEALREETIDEFGKLQKELDQRRTELTNQLDKKIVEEFKQRLTQFDARLNDVISSYLVETLGDRADLGTQGPVILQALEGHKEDIKRDILS